MRDLIFFLFTALIFYFHPLSSQNFSYSLTTSNQTYSALTNATGIAVNTSSATSSRISIGFPFEFADSSFQYVTISSSGKLFFDNHHRFIISAFGETSVRADPNGNPLSNLSYKLTGDAGSRILSIEYSGFTFQGPDSIASFQVELHEGSNQVVIQTGSNTFSALADSIMTFPLVFINSKMDTGHKAFIISGNPANPVATVITDIGNMAYLVRFPSIGMRYTLSPQSN